MLYVNPIGLRDPKISAAADPSQAREKAATQELERYFAYMLMQEMRRSIPKDTLFGSGNEMKLFNEMLDDAFAGEIARSGQWGIADQIAQQIQPQINVNNTDQQKAEFPINTPKAGLSLSNNRIGLTLNKSQTALPLTQPKTGFPMQHSQRSSNEQNVPINQLGATGVVQTAQLRSNP